MATLEDPPDGWVVWNDEPDGRCTLVYRPDVFDTATFPPMCLPTIHVTNAPRDTRHPGWDRAARPDADWRVQFYLEPDVPFPDEPTASDRESAVTIALDLAARFTEGELAYRSLYQVPRKDYLEELDALVGRDT